jgi:hypothetical protein
MERHFYRCLDCLEVQAADGPILRGQWIHGKQEWPHCDCGGNLDWMGKVHGSVLGKMHTACACDGRCTHALGGSCDCICGGANHGTGRLVRFLTGIQTVPQIAPRADLEVRKARVVEWKAAKEAAKARIAAKYGDTYTRFQSGQWIDSTLYWEIKDELSTYRKASGYATHTKRMSALAKIAQPMAQAA